VTYEAVRLLDAPIIDASSHASIGHNIQGPSLIRVPDWVPDALGRYYLYFADHKGAYIRLAYADDLIGPWTVHEPGSLQLADSRFPTQNLTIDADTEARYRAAYEKALGAEMPVNVLDDLVVAHIASPDVHVDHERREIVMYFHGLVDVSDQQTRVAVSPDGLSFTALPDLLGPSYFRCFRHGDWWYALAMPGLLLRSRDGRTDFESGPRLFEPSMRHSAVRVTAGAAGAAVLEVFWTRVGHAPERILCSSVALDGDWMAWQDAPAIEVLRPERPWEGADQPDEPSRRGAIDVPVNQLRDPCVYEEDGRLFLLYAVAGESGIGIVELHSGGAASSSGGR